MQFGCFLCSLTAQMASLGRHALAAQPAVRRSGKRKQVKRKKAKRGETKKWGKQTRKARQAKENEPKRPLSPTSIFGNERRPAIISAIRAKGEKINKARIRKQLAALWDAETNKPKYFHLAHKDKERYADEKVAFDWEETTAKKRNRLAESFEDAAQTPPSRDDVAQPLGAAAASVYSYAVGYLQPFLVKVDGANWVDPPMARNRRTRWAALQLMAAGRGPLRAPTCDHILRMASGRTAPGQASLRRALLLVGPGELQELHELRTLLGEAEGSCDFIISLLRQQAAGSRLDGDVAPVSTVLASLRVIKAETAVLSAILIQQCAATLTELECASMTSDADRVLPLCTRLSSLTLSGWWSCPPAAWLGLSQLHTLRGVSLAAVPAAAIAAALPRLHTLHLKHDVTRFDFPVAAFYDELLPRLRSFHLKGSWPETSDRTQIADVPALPLLEDLGWRCWMTNNLPRRLMGALPSMLDISHEDLAVWLKAIESPTVASPLARVRTLSIRLGVTKPERPFVARVLRAAPQLRDFTFDVHFALWRNALAVFSGAYTLQRSFPPLAHLQLRRMAIFSENSPLDVPVPGGYGVRLRRRHFPRLRRFAVGDREYPVWVLSQARAGLGGAAHSHPGNDNFVETSVLRAGL
jgi:hypothetical protein